MAGFFSRYSRMTPSKARRCSAGTSARLGCRRLILSRDALHKHRRTHESRRDKTDAKIPDHENLPQSRYTVLVTPALSATNIIRCGFYPSKPTRCVEARRAETTTDAFGAQPSFGASNVKNHQKSADLHSTVAEPVQQHLIPCKEVRIEKAGQTDQAAGESQISWES